MAETTRQDAQQRRSEGRERRRSLLTEPFERLSDAASGSGDAPRSEVRETMKRAALTAAVAAAVGAAGGVAKTLLDRRNESGDENQSEPEGRADDSDAESDEPEGRAEAVDEEEDDEPEGRAEPVDDEGDDEPEGRAEPVDDEEAEDEPQGRAEAVDDDEDEDEQFEGDEGEEQEGRAEPAEHVDDDQDEDQAEDGRQQGRAEPATASGEQEDGDDERASLDDAAGADSEPAKIVPQARRALEQLLGREAESVSGFEHENGHWKVNLEVVELRRIPDSSDVLGSYELVLDDEGKVARMTRTRRYQRSDVEGG
jgi:hypothetical protein